MSDLISRKALCEYALNQKDKSITPNDIMRFPSAQPEKRTQERTETNACDLISRQVAIDALHDEIVRRRISEDSNDDGALDEFDTEAILRRLPSAQPERKTGYWHVTDAYPHNVYCSECHKKYAQTHWAVWEDGSLPRNFCPNCGADMRGEQDG